MTSAPPKWIKPQLTRLVDEAPAGSGWLHEIKYDGYRMHARIDGADVKLLTRTGLDWSHRYRRTIEALRGLKVKSAYIDGELCALRPDGVPAFSRLQAAMDEGRTDELVLFVFDLLFLNGESTTRLPLTERKARLKRLFRKEIDGLRYTEHVIGDGPRFREHACKLGLEGAISKRADQPYAPGDRGIWVKSKCLNREEFVVVGWTEPEGSRQHIGALLLGYYTEDGRLRLCRPCWHRTDREGAEAPGGRPGAAAGGEDAARGAAAARQPLRLAAAAFQGSLGSTRGGRRGDLPDLDGGQPAAAGLVPRPARGQASAAGDACAASPR